MYSMYVLRMVQHSKCVYNICLCEIRIVYINLVMCDWCRRTCQTLECMHTLRRWRRRRLSAEVDVGTVAAATYSEDAFWWCNASLTDWTTDSFVPTSILMPFADYCTGFHWHIWNRWISFLYSLLVVLLNCFISGVVPLRCRYIKCALLLRHVFDMVDVKCIQHMDSEPRVSNPLEHGNQNLRAWKWDSYSE